MDSPQSRSESPVSVTTSTHEYENQAFSTIEDGLTVNSTTPTATYIKTLQRLTNEALPNINLYRDHRSINCAVRPSLDELHNADTRVLKDPSGRLEETQVDKPAGATKFGWITGVLVRCMLNIWGPIMFLRLTAIVGRAGIIQAIIVILLSTAITSVTGLSISAISTNGMVKGGGTYYLISRSLGPEFGGAIGLIFSFANAVAVAMHTVGFAESLQDLLEVTGVSIVDGGLNDMRIIGVITAICLVTITMVGMEWEQKAQVVLLVILLVAIVDLVVGSFIPPDDEKKARGFMGWSAEILSENIGADYRGEDFFRAFSLFFPASTGILAGVNISGDLKDPSSAIPKGTLGAIFITSGCYILFVIIAGCTTYRDADGSVESFLNGTFRDCAANYTCAYGLQNNYQVMELISAFGYLIYAGCFAATLSSALACLVSAPKIFQALANDKVYPILLWFGKGFGKSGEPLRSYVLAFLIAVAFILVGELNIIAPIISNFFMAAYCLINFACFHAALYKSPGFRPSFRFWNQWVSLICAIVCSAVMFIMSWQTALLTFAICLALYVYLSYKKPDVNWGSSNQAASYTSALRAAHALSQHEEHIKNYRPQILVMTGSPTSRPALVDFTHHIIKGIGLMVCGNVIKTPMSSKLKTECSKGIHEWLLARKVKAFYTIIEEDNLSKGTKALAQAVGVGKLRPNMLMLGYMNNWQTRDPVDVMEYFNTIHVAFDLNLSVGILRVEGGLDFSFFTEEEISPMSSPLPTSAATLNGKVARDTASSSTASLPDSNETRLDFDDDPSPPLSPRLKKFFSRWQKKKEEPVATKDQIPEEIIVSMDMFRSKRPKATIDVWWLYDDGGLTLLIPYILRTRKYWEQCKLRVFSLANKDHELNQEQLNLAALLRKFRIAYSDLTVLPSVTKMPGETSMMEFDLFLKNLKDKGGSDGVGLSVSEAELETLKHKTHRYIRIRELLMRHSRNADLVVMTLPIPKKNKVPAALYLAWLEALTKDLPPTLLVRGNQSSVLTFYS